MTLGGADALGQRGTGSLGLTLALNVVQVGQDSSEVQAWAVVSSHIRHTWRTP